MTTHGEIHWSELMTEDVEGAKAFFANVAGWTISEMPMPNGAYNVCMAGERPVAGIMEVGMGDSTAPAGWYTYVHVDDVDAACSAVTANGGAVGRRPFDVPGVGRIAMVTDPGGSVVGLITPAETGA